MSLQVVLGFDPAKALKETEDQSTINPVELYRHRATESVYELKGFAPTGVLVIDETVTARLLEIGEHQWMFVTGEPPFAIAEAIASGREMEWRWDEVEEVRWVRGYRPEIHPRDAGRNVAIGIGIFAAIMLLSWIVVG